MGQKRTLMQLTAKHKDPFFPMANMKYLGIVQHTKTITAQ